MSIREAIAHGDLSAYEDVLAPDVVWVGLWPGQLCRNRDEVLEMLRTAQANGIDARPVRAYPDREAALAAMEPPW